MVLQKSHMLRNVQNPWKHRVKPIIMIIIIVIIVVVVVLLYSGYSVVFIVNYYYYYRWSRLWGKKTDV